MPRACRIGRRVNVRKMRKAMSRHDSRQRNCQTGATGIMDAGRYRNPLVLALPIFGDTNYFNQSLDVKNPTQRRTGGA